MTFTMKTVLLALAASAVSAVPNPGHHHHNHMHSHHAKRSGYVPCQPAGWTAGMQAQWKGMQDQELAALKQETAGETASQTTANNYKQAGLGCEVSSAFAPADPWDILLNCPLAQAANDRQRENYPAFGSMDLTAEDIGNVYAPAIEAASAKSGVPKDIIVKMIWVESKGHPLVSNGGLCQIDPVAWGQMVVSHECLKNGNRYTPKDNIMAAALYLASKGTCNDTSCWNTLYANQYQDPNAAARAAAAA